MGGFVVFVVARRLTGREASVALILGHPLGKGSQAELDRNLFYGLVDTLLSLLLEGLPVRVELSCLASGHFAGIDRLLLGLGVDLIGGSLVV